MIDPEDFLSHAKTLLENPEGSEVIMRSAISRAYYSLFHEALSFLKQRHKGKIIKQIKDWLDDKNYDNTRLIISKASILEN
jgi:uncharacterized protein (UPF0332 family)